MKLKRENTDLNIDFTIHECLKHSFKKIVFLNFDEGKNIDISKEKQIFEEIASNFDLTQCVWKIQSDYKTYQVNDNWYEFIVAEFIVKIRCYLLIII